MKKLIIKMALLCTVLVAGVATGRVRVKFDPPLVPKDGFRQELKLRNVVSYTHGIEFLI